MLKVTTNSGRTFRINWQHWTQLKKNSGTDCIVEVDDGTFLLGESILHKGDTFNKELGRTISLGRALTAKTDGKKLVTDKEREEIEDAYKHRQR